MKTKYLLIFGFLVLLSLYGCSKEEQPTVQETAPPIQGMVVEEVKTLPSCDDNNSCTEDKFNELTNECEHVKLERCCGDGVCDTAERCDLSIHSTICTNDCPKKCPAFVVVEEWKCEGKCFETQEHYSIDGDATLKTKLENIGELGTAEIFSFVNCVRPTGGEFNTDGDYPIDGILIKGYFDNEEETVYLTGKPFGRNSADYTLEFKGKPEKDFRLKCTVLFTANEFYYNKDFNVNFVSIQ